MKITITKHHVLTAQESQGQYNPVELAIMEQDCFEEVTFKMDFQQLDLDGEHMVLPRNIQTALRRFVDTGEMRPMTFNLEIEQPVMLIEEEFLLESENFDLDLNYNFL